MDSLAVFFFFATLPIEQFRLGDTFQFCPFTAQCSGITMYTVIKEMNDSRMSPKFIILDITDQMSFVI